MHIKKIVHKNYKFDTLQKLYYKPITIHSIVKTSLICVEYLIFYGLVKQKYTD